MELTAASWNIWVFGDRDMEAIAERIREEDIDIIGIQEAAIYHDEKPPLNSSREIADRLGYNYEFFPAADFREQDSEREDVLGNAIISRYPIKDSESYDLNPDDVSFDGTPQKEPRVLGAVRISVDGSPVHFLTTHLQYSHRFKTTDIRLAEVQKILSVVDRIDTPFVLAGDFNTPLEREEIKLLEESLERVSGDEPTWTLKPFEFEGWRVDEPEYRLDNVFVSEDLSCRKSEPIMNEVSDHLMVKSVITSDTSTI